MSVYKTGNLWQRWDIEVKRFKDIVRHQPPNTTIRHWQRYLLFIFMQELSKNVLNENESITSIIDRIIEAIQIACGFERVRVYLVKEGGKNTRLLYLYKTSKNHDPIDKHLNFKIEEGTDDAVDTLFTRDPLVVERAQIVKLEYRDVLNAGGPYAAIPLFIDKKPYGLICADISSLTTSNKSADNVNYLEYKEHFQTFAHSVIAAIENRHTFEQRNRKIKQFELVKEFNELIEVETDREKLLNSFMEHCVNVVHADGGHLKFYNQETEELERVAAYGKYVTPSELKSRPVAIGFSNKVFREKEALVVDDLTNHPLMLEHIKYGKEKGYEKYVKILEHRKSILIVPLIKHTGEVYGVLDLHSKDKNKFTQGDKENLLALASSVTYAVDKTQQLKKQNDLLDQQQGILETREKFLTMLQEAVGKAHDLKSVLRIIRDSCYKLEIVKGIKNVCLSIKDPFTGQLTTPSDQCFKPNKKCNLCLKDKLVIQAVLKSERPSPQKDRNGLALPIVLKNEVIGVLYFEGQKEIVLTPDEKNLLGIITSTAAILISTAKNYDEKIKQSATLYKVGQLSTRARDFREWFNLVMEKVLDVIGSGNRKFYLVMVENDGKTLVVRAVTPLFIEGYQIQSKGKLLGIELPVNECLSGEVVRSRAIKIITDVGKNKKLKEGDPEKLPYFEYDDRIMSEVGIPLKIKEGDTEKVIGVLIIDSVVPNDFKDFDSKLHETIANYLTTIIHNQQIYEERAKYQEQISRIDRSISLNTILRFFYHEFKDSIQNILLGVNNLEDAQKADQKDIDYLKDQANEQFSIFERLQNAFIKTAPRQEQRQICELIQKSINAIEITTGFDITLVGNYQDVDYIVECYPDHIDLAFRAIINNAVKFSRQIDRNRRYLKIDISPAEKEGYINISFESPTIAQISTEEAEIIFQPFKRGTDKEEGEGLGLAIADLSIKRHRGEITVINVGTDAIRFTITLPFNKYKNRGGIIR